MLANNETGSATGSGGVDIGGSAILAGHGHIQGDVSVLSNSQFISAGNIVSSEDGNTNLNYLPTLSITDQDQNSLGFGGDLTINSEYRVFLGALEENVGLTQLTMTGNDTLLNLSQAGNSLSLGFFGLAAGAVVLVRRRSGG